MAWPTEQTPPFYVHDKTCAKCGKGFDGFAQQKYCSPNCIEMSKRARMMAAWGVPADVIAQLTEGD